MLVGHGLRRRCIEGPHAPGEGATDTEVRCRRYLCRACGKTLVVVPRGVGRAVRYSLSAIAYALALWGYAKETAAATRKAVSAATARGFTSPEQWSSLRRWTAHASTFFGLDPKTMGTLRERAASLAAYLACLAPLPSTHVPSDAFFGARYVHAR